MKRDREERRVKQAEGIADPANGVKFDEVDETDQLQLATLAYRGAKFVELVVRNSSDLRSKRSASDGVWNEERKQVSLTKPKGKSFQVMGWSERELTWLHPEEALWLLDGGQLALKDSTGKDLPRSWLWQRLFCSNDIHGFGPQHYSAYQHLRSSGYPTRRWSRRAPTPEMSIQDPRSWHRMMEQEGGIANGWIVFEVWAPHEAASFRRSSPPKSSWRILPWSIDADCGAAAAWNRVAGAGAMMALSGSAGTRCSFLEVAKCQIGANPAAPQARDLVLRVEKARAQQQHEQAAAQQSRDWFPKAQDWITQ